MSHTQNFYLLKMHLISYEISNRVLKFENLIQIWKRFIPSENLFQTWSMQSGVMCVDLTLSCDKLEYTHMAALHRIHVGNKVFRQDKTFSDWNWIFKFQNSIWDFKQIQMDFQEIIVLGISWCENSNFCFPDQTTIELRS